MTGGRVLRLRKWVEQTRLFMMTYGDGVADLDLSALVAFHRRHGRLATVTAVRPPARFGGITIDGDRVAASPKSPRWAKAGSTAASSCSNREVLDYIDGDLTAWEHEPMERLTAEGQLMAYRHDGFWQPMDTVRERNLLEALWQSGRAPWKVWP